MPRIFLQICLAGLCFPVANVAEAQVEGNWMISLQDGSRTLVGLLEIEQVEGGWRAFLEGGPASVSTEGDSIVIVADSRDVRGFVFDRHLTGTIEGDVMSGTYAQIGAAAQKESPGPWRGERVTGIDETDAVAAPADLSGTWTATQELDFRKYTMSLTSAGEAWLAEYLPYYDQPDVRCTSIGLPALTTYSFPFEIIVTPERMTMIYEYQSKVRRVWLDEREVAEFVPPSRMGHSNGRWDGDTFVVQTQNLEKTVRDFRGELISENARIEERYSLSEDGETLTAIITVIDPDNYARPPVRRRQWQRDNNAAIFPYTCDPDSFYLKMYEDGELDMYIERSSRRF